MKRSEFFLGSGVLFLLALLFSPKDSDVWIAFLVLAVVSGISGCIIQGGE